MEDKQLSYFDQLPDTLQGLNLYKNYAERQMKSNNSQNKKFEKLIAECERRITIKEKGAKNDNTT